VKATTLPPPIESVSVGNPPVRKTSLLSEEAKLRVTDELIRWFGITVSKLSAMIY
jgi:hypothetical protein